MTTSFTPTRIGVIKSGGIANGPFGAGAYRVLSECLKQHGMEISKVVANSAQTFSILLESVGRFDEIIKIWSELTVDDVFKLHYWGKPLNPLARDAILDSNPLRRNVEIWSRDYLDEIVSDRATPFEIVVTDLKTGKSIYYPNKPEYKAHLVDICMASAGLIPFLKPTVVEIAGKKMILGDGGFTDNMPLRRLLDDGCDLIFIVDAYGGDVGAYDPEELNWPDLLTRVFGIVVNRNSRLSLALNNQKSAVASALDHMESRLVGCYGSGSEATKIIEEARRTLDVHGSKKFKLVRIKCIQKFNTFGLKDINPDNMETLIELGYWSAKLAMYRLGLNSDKV